MKIESYLPVFPGFYNTIFEANEEPYIEDGKTYDDYEWNYQEYRQRISKACVAGMEELLSDHFKISIEFQKLVSPREYNFTTDSINVRYELSENTYKEIIKYLNNNSETFSSYIKDRYTSCSGFYSYYSNDALEWLKMLKEGEDLAHVFGSVLEFICENEEITCKNLYYKCDHEMYVDGELIE